MSTKPKLPILSIRPKLKSANSTSQQEASSASSASGSKEVRAEVHPKEVRAEARPKEEVLEEFLMAEDRLGYAAKLPIPEMAQLLETLADAYYNSDALVSDQLYDDIQKVLMLIDPENPVLQEIGAPIRTEGDEDIDEIVSFNMENYPELLKRGKSFVNPNYRNKTKLPFLMPSMDKVKSDESSQFASWLGENLGNGSNFNISDKLDGISIGLAYRIDPVTKKIVAELFTRGNKGVEGRDISIIIPYLRLPKTPEDVIRANGHLYLRGEMIISRTTFKSTFDNETMSLRNVVLGIIGRKTFNTAFLELVDLVIYELVSPWNSKSFTEGLQFVKKLGYNVVPNQLVNPLPSLNELNDILIKRKKESNYDLDGLILTQDHLPTRDIKLGQKYPTYAIAFKFSSDSDDVEYAITIVRHVRWDKSKDGLLKPVAVVKPVGLGNQENVHFTVHNARHVVEYGVGPGAILRVVKGGEIIPYIAGYLRPVEPQMPDIPYEWNKTGSEIRILNPDDDEEVMITRIQYFFRELKVSGWGPATVEKIVKKNWPAPTGILDILDMNTDEFAEAGYHGKMGPKLYENLHAKLSNVDLATFMAATNIFGAGWGEKRFQAILEAIPDLLEEPFKTDEDRRRLLQKIVSVRGFGQLTAEPLVAGLPPFIAFLYGVYRLGWIGIYKMNPLPEPYIRPDPNGNYRTDRDLDIVWDDLQAIGYTKKDYTSEEYAKTSIIQKALFDAVHNDLAAYADELAEEQEKAKEKEKTKVKRPNLPMIMPRKIAATSSASTSATSAASATSATSAASAASATSGTSAASATSATSSAPIKPILKSPAIKVTKAAKPSLLGKTVVFTGVHAGVEDKAKMLGAKVTGSVSGSTGLLVVKDESFTSSKVTKAKENGVPIMTLAEFNDTYF